MFAYIPARGGSKRVPRKNIFMIQGKPLLSYVIENLKGVAELSGIAVSSEDEEILAIANSNGAQTLGKRIHHLAHDMTTFMDLVNEDIMRFAEYFNDYDVLFVLPTSALITSSYYQKAIEIFHAQKKQGLVISVVAAHPSPLLSFREDAKGALTPLFPEMFNRPTKDLPNTYTDCGSFYAFNLNLMKNKKMFIDLKPIFPVVLSSEIGIDVDTFEDIKILEKKLEKKDE